MSLLEATIMRTEAGAVRGAVQLFSDESIWAIYLRSAISPRHSVAGRRSDGLPSGPDEGAKGGPDSDLIRITIRSAFNSISGREEGVESLNERRISRKKRRDTVNHPRCVNAEKISI